MRRAALGLRRLSASPERRAVETMVVGEQTVPRAHAPPANLDALNVALDQLRRAHPGAIFDRYLEHVPTVGSDALVCAGAAVVGDVRIGVGASVWYNAVLRADLNYIELGAHSNLQDGTVVHLGNNDPTVIGDHVVVGHRAVLHGCTIEPHCLIGMQVIAARREPTQMIMPCVCHVRGRPRVTRIGDILPAQATVLDGAVIGRGSIIGAGAIVSAGAVIPPLSLVLGVPGKVRRPVPVLTTLVREVVGVRIGGEDAAG